MHFGVDFQSVRKGVVLLQWLLLACLPLPAMAKPLDIAAASAGPSHLQSPLNLIGHVQLLEDPTAMLTLDDVRGDAVARFFRSGFLPGDSMDFGFTRSAYWMRVEFTNSGSLPVQRMLELENPTLGSVHFSMNSGSGPFSTLHTGVMEPYATRAYPNRHFVFPVEVPAGGSRTVYMRIETRNTMVLTLNLWEPIAFQLGERSDYMLQAVFAGAMLAIFMYNALLWLNLRLRVYSYYLAYSLLMTLSINTITGVTGELFKAHTGWMQDLAYAVGISLATACFYQFLRLMLEMKERLPRINNLMHAGTVFYLLAPFLYAAFFEQFISIYVTSFIVTTSIGLVVLIYSIARGVPGARQVFLGYLCLAVGSQLYTLASLDLLPPNLITRNGLLMGAAFEMVFLAFALASRFNVIRRESARMQLRALDTEKQLVDALRLNERRLEGMVEVRTQALRTTQKELEDAKEKAEAGTRAKSEFLATMSHEIRTPLHAIVGMTYLLLHTQIDAKARNYANKIGGAANNLQVIVDDILDFSKLEADKLELETIEFELQSVLAQVTDLFGSRALAKNILLSCEPCPWLPGPLVGDPVRIGQILTNLVGNAIKFTRVGEVSIGVDVLRQYPDRVDLVLRVSDTGIGISEAQRALIFLPFSQADATVTRKFGGSGLGLTICKRLVDLMGGQIRVESTLHGGSTFSVQLSLPWLAPTEVSAATPTGPVAIALPDGADLLGLRVLLVEDDALNLEMAKDLLTGVGIEVDVAWDGQQCLQQLARHDYDLVLMDCQMPVMDGFSATRELRKDPRWQHLPVIALTANPTTETLDRAQAAGMNAVIGKPINPLATLLTIGQWAKKGIRRHGGSADAVARY